MQAQIMVCAMEVLVILIVICMAARRCRSRIKLRKMGEEERAAQLSVLTKPFGFVCKPEEEILVSTEDAWQRKYGYEALYDALAPHFNMIFDHYPVYFDYQGKTWLIEFWKGQYGINTGAEAGIYHANRLIPKGQRELVHYNAVSDDEMPLIGICLEQKGRKLFTEKKYHWWLAVFAMGVFGPPETLKMYVSLTFGSSAMAQAFWNGLKETEIPADACQIQGEQVSLVLCDGAHYGKMTALYRWMIQQVNGMYCILYHMITWPYRRMTGKMLFLYGQSPWCFRHMLRLHAFGRKHR